MRPLRKALRPSLHLDQQLHRIEQLPTILGDDNFGVRTACSVRGCSHSDQPRAQLPEVPAANDRNVGIPIAGCGAYVSGFQPSSIAHLSQCEEDDNLPAYHCYAGRVAHGEDC